MFVGPFSRAPGVGQSTELKPANRKPSPSPAQPSPNLSRIIHAKSKVLPNIGTTVAMVVSLSTLSTKQTMAAVALFRGVLKMVLFHHHILENGLAKQASDG